MRLWLDLETYNDADLGDVGGYLYAETAEVLLVAYAIDDGPVQCWDLTETADVYPADLTDALFASDCEIVAHGAMFDRPVLERAWPDDMKDVALERWRCTMAQALSHALPAGLSELCNVLDVPEDKAKLAEGKKLIRLFTMPQPANRKLRRATRTTHPTEWERFKRYAINDIQAMRECAARMPTWNWDTECIAQWHADQRVNDRGFCVDRELTQAGARASEAEKVRLTARFVELTGGVVERPSQRAQFQAYLNERFGFDLDNTRSDTFLQLLKNSELDTQCAELMRICIAANKSSTAKYAALDAATSSDGRFRGGLQFAGAGRTRRWAGRKFQGQNLPARALPPARDVEQFIDALKVGVQDILFADHMRLASAALRGCVVAPPGKKINVADLSNIEGRMLAWAAGEQWKLEAFREYDAGLGPDLYNITAVSIVGGDPWHVPKIDRNVFGKVPDLACGYQGGVKGFQTFAKAYNVRMIDHWPTIQRAVSQEHTSQALRNFAKWGAAQAEELEIDKWEWIASESCKLAWRARHPATKRLWYGLQETCQMAIRNWGATFSIGRHLKVRCATFRGHRWMLIRLPSGRLLTYFNPALVGDEQTITYEGEAAEEGSTTRMWVTVYTHGGKLTGNVCQTLARDVLAPKIAEAESRGYLPVLTVHDELVTESEDSDAFSGDDLAKLMATNPAWAPDLPLAAAGFSTYRYRKD